MIFRVKSIEHDTSADRVTVELTPVDPVNFETGAIQEVIWRGNRVAAERFYQREYVSLEFRFMSRAEYKEPERGQVNA